MIAISDKEFKRLASYVQSHYGINLAQKKTLLESRLQSILAEKNFRSFSEYYDYILNDGTGEAAAALVDKLTTNHTFFLREVAHFKYFRDEVLPRLKAVVKSKDLGIWSAGCSTGEEPYTLAMIIADFFGPEKPLWDTRILATDISRRVLNIAAEGVYTEEQIVSIPDAWRKKYFKQIERGKYKVAENIRNEVIFRAFNLNNSCFPFKKKFHVIFCRNVMIYFDASAKKKLVRKFYEFTEPGGYLFIGHSESLSREESPYAYVQPAVYRKQTSSAQ